MNQQTRNGGFTLIETMVAVGIAGVLSSIAYPSFAGRLVPMHRDAAGRWPLVRPSDARAGRLDDRGRARDAGELGAVS